MCGICGIINYRKATETGREALIKMCALLRHRGPDDEGIYINKGSPTIGLGHRRLSIIDLSPAGHQPMSNEDETVWIVFNGEIYNYKELRIELEKKGHTFKSNTDTETITHLYEEYNKDCVRYLCGMFAFAIWDSNNKLLFLARDRLGKKPLLYHYKNDIFAFASEFMALIASGYISKDINLKSIPDYFTFGYIPAPESIYKDILKLLPGHTLLLKDREIKIQPYWQLDYTKKINIPFEEAVRNVNNLLVQAVKIRLFSDVPLGVFLSGGTDSSTIVSLISRFSSNKIKTFSIGFDDKDFDELKYAKLVAKHFNTEHYEFIVKPNALEILPELVEHYGEPYADSSCIPTYYLANKTRQHVTVALNGDGGDELFAGYERYRAIYLSCWYGKIPHILKNSFIEPIADIIPYRPNSKNKINRFKRFLKAAKLTLPNRYLRWVAVCDLDFQNSLYSQGFVNKISKVNPARFFLPFFNNSGRQDLLDTLLCIDTNTYLPNDLLVKMDIATMANSLEGRSPFLDHRLIEFVASLRHDFKMRWLIKKYLLKFIIKDFLPKENIYRPKMGFGVPIGRWFRNELKVLLTETLLSRESLNREYFNIEFIKSIIRQHLEQKQDFSHQLWSLLMFELWHKRFID